jgi:shikimate kinase
MKNIVLVGFMGTGKTEASKILASRLKRQRLCIDDMVEWKVGKSITKIFEEDGEPYFRRMESEIVAAISKDKDVIIDAGGGVIISELNVKRLKEHGILICLTARPEVILDRTRNYHTRPLLNCATPLESIKELLEKRQQYYERADYTLDTSDILPEEVADKILKIMAEAEVQKKPYLIFQ